MKKVLLMGLVLILAMVTGAYAADFPKRPITSKIRSGSTKSRGVCFATHSKLVLSMASPAKIAMSSPYTTWRMKLKNYTMRKRKRTYSKDPNNSEKHTWLVGFPLLKSSLSILGKSSWIKLIVWIISKAAAVGMAASLLPPNISQAARHKTGRTRFPPAMREYLIASEIKSVMGGSILTQVSSRAFVISGCIDMTYSFKSKDVLASASAVLFNEVGVCFARWLGPPTEKASVDTHRAAIASKVEPENLIFLCICLWLTGPGRCKIVRKFGKRQERLLSQMNARHLT